MKMTYLTHKPTLLNTWVLEEWNSSPTNNPHGLRCAIMCLVLNQWHYKRHRRKILSLVQKSHYHIHYTWGWKYIQSYEVVWRRARLYGDLCHLYAWCDAKFCVRKFHVVHTHSHIFSLKFVVVCTNNITASCRCAFIIHIISYRIFMSRLFFNFPSSCFLTSIYLPG